MTNPTYTRITVDTDAYPDLIFIELGMSPNNLLGVWTVLTTLPGIYQSTKSEGLLEHNLGVIMKGLRPHFIIRQYWRSFADLERYARGSQTHQSWWRDILTKGTRHTTIWHETYSVRGGIDAIYGSSGKFAPVGLSAFAPTHTARGSAYSARQRMNATGDETAAAPVTESVHAAYDAEHNITHL